MSKPNLLVVEDEAHIRCVLERAFIRGGYDVELACHGAEGLEKAAARTPDAIVSDFQMPGLSGVEMIRALASQPALSQVPVLLLTARGHAIPPEDLAGLGLHAIVPKPFSAKDLVRRVDDMIEASAERSRAA